MKVTVCELHNQTPADLVLSWEGLVAHTHAEQSDLVLLPEMPFYRWLYAGNQVHPDHWQATVDAHDEWSARLGELGATVVVGSRATTRAGTPINEGFVWEAQTGIRGVHVKRYLPDEPDFWEASWYRRGEGTFQAAQTAVATIGMMICTDLWFMHHAREYGEQGIHLLLNPRATEWGTREKWLTGGRTAGIIAGAFCLSSCPVADKERHGVSLGGQGWVTNPDGEVLALTSPKQPFVTIDIDLEQAVLAKQTYPRYVQR